MRGLPPACHLLGDTLFPLPLRQGQRLGQLTSIRASVHHMHRGAWPHLSLFSLGSALAVPTPMPACCRLWVCPGCFSFLYKLHWHLFCILHSSLRRLLSGDSPETQNLIPPTQASRSEGTLQVSRAGCSPSCLERCPTIPAPRSPQMPISASSTGSPPGLCVPPLSVLGLGRPHMDPQKTPNSQRTREKQPIGRCHAL